MWTYSTDKQREYRKLRLESLAEMAKKTALTAETLSNIERGSLPSVKTYLAIINAYGLPAGAFFEQKIDLV